MQYKPVCGNGMDINHLALLRFPAICRAIVYSCLGGRMLCICWYSQAKKLRVAEKLLTYRKRGRGRGREGEREREREREREMGE